MLYSHLHNIYLHSNLIFLYDILGLYGHSAVFHKQSNAIYVFGGMEYQTDQNQASSNVYALDFRKYAWNILQSEPGNRVLMSYSIIV